MALITYLTKAQRYQNIMTDEYETLPFDDLALIDEYFSWKKARYEAKYENGMYYCSTLEEWCGVPESKLAHKYVVNYYHEHFKERPMYHEMIGETEGYSIFTSLARLVKMNQLFDWLIKNVMNNEINKEHYEITKSHLEDLLKACAKVKENIQIVNENDYLVDKKCAEKYFPLMKETGYFFGTNEYDHIYARQVIEIVDIVKSILDETNFETEAIYVNTIW